MIAVLGKIIEGYEIVVIIFPVTGTWTLATVFDFESCFAFFVDYMMM